MDRMKVKIEGLDEKGRGRAGQYYCYFYYPGDEILGRRRGKRIVVEELIEASKDRCRPFCKHFGKCGGCKLQGLRYKAQLKFKQDMAEKYLSKFGKVKRIIKSPRTRYYRNKMEYVIAHGKVGLKEPEKWWAVVQLEECHLLSKECSSFFIPFRDYLKSTGLPFWDLRKQKGFWRYIVIKEGKFTGERMVTIVTHEGKVPGDLVEKLESLFPVTTVYHGVNPRITDISYSFKLELLHGERFLKEKLLDIHYLIHPNSFFQPNPWQAERMVKMVKEKVSGPNVLDLYCGVGTFALQVADKCEKVVGVEMEELSIQMAIRSAKINGISNVEFVKSRVEDLSEIRAEEVIVDPPRSGLHPKVVRMLRKSKAERIIYVSCNPTTLARDLGELEKDFELEYVQPLDMFPHTPHLECIAFLVRK